MAWSMRVMWAGSSSIGAVLKSILPAFPLRVIAMSECAVMRPSLMASHNSGFSRIFW